MKNLKKVLALVLAFACAFTMFAGALTFSDVQSGDDYSAAITMLSDLEVISGNGKGAYEPDKAITRAEACVLIANIMNGGKADTARFAGGSNFTDVAKTYWGESAIAYCVQMGVTYGVGNGMFAPNRVITDAEFVAMVTRAMGYDTPTNPLKFPYGNYAAAVDNGIVDNVPYVEGSDCTKGEAAQILYDCLFADYARYTANQNLIHNADDDHDFHNKLIDVVFGLNRAALGDGKWTSDNFDCEAHYWVIAGVNCDEKKSSIVAYAIDDKDNDISTDKDKVQTFEFDGDVTELLGYKVILWGEESHSNDAPVIDKVKAIEVVDGVNNDDAQKVYEYNASMDDDDNNGKTKFDGETVEFDGVENAEGLFGVTGKKDVEKALNVKNGSTYKIFDWDNDGKADWIVEYVNEYYTVTSVTSKTLRLESPTQTKTGLLNKLAINLDDDTEVSFACPNDESKKTAHDIEISIPDKTEEDDILCLSYIRGGLNGELSNACTYENEGKWELTKVEPDSKEVTDVDTKKGVAFDSEYIDVADDAYCFEDTAKVYDEMDEDDETAYDVWVDATGFVIKLAETDETWKGYIFVTGASDGSKQTGDRGLAEISGVTGENEYLEDVKVNKDAKITGDDGDIEFYNDSTRKFDLNPKGLAFKYKMNDDGEIVRMDRVAETGKNDYTFTDKTDALSIVDDNNYRYWLDNADVIFAIEYDEAEYANGQNGYGAAVIAAGNEKFGVDSANGYVSETSMDDADLDEDKVLAVKVSEIPDIDKHDGTAEKTHSRGLAADFDSDKKDEVSAAVLAVDSLRWFSNTTIKAGLVTKMTYHPASDTYTVEIDGEDSYKTVDEDDVYINGDKNEPEKLNTMYESLTKNAKKYGIYVEYEVNSDDEIIALTEMDQPTTTDDLPTTSKIPGRKIDNSSKFEVVRAVVNRVTLDKSLTMTAAQSADADDHIYFVENAQYTDYFELQDDTKFFEIDEDVRLPEKGAWLVTTDGFSKQNFDISEGSQEDLYSIIRNNEDNDRYIVADVIVDDGDVVAVYYYKNYVEEDPNTYVPAIGITVTPETVVRGETQEISVAVDYTKGYDLSKVNWRSISFDDGTGISWNKWADAEKSAALYTVANTIVTGTHKVTLKDTSGNEIGTDTFKVIAKESVTKVEYSAAAVKVTFSSADAAAEYAKNPNLFTIYKDGQKVNATAARVGVQDNKTVLLKVDMPDVTSTTPVSVVVVDSDNFDVNNTAVVGGYDNSMVYGA